MIKDKSIIPAGKIEQRILLIRGEKVLIDADLAEFYGVQTRRLNEQIKRNRERVFHFLDSKTQRKIKLNGH